MDRLHIELVYEPTCPNVEQARDAIRRALAVLGVPVTWHEWVRDDSATPTALRELASPSVVVTGQDVGGGDGSIAAAAANARLL